MLNANELKVLEGVKIGHKWAGGDFTYADEVAAEVEGLRINQVKGYLSQLKQKRYIQICEEYSQIIFLKKALEIYPDLEETCLVY